MGFNEEGANMIKIAKWLLEVDIEQTREFYRKDIEMCTCLNCRNYVKATQTLNASIISIFNSLGIDPAKPGQLSDFPAIEEVMHEYIGSYRFFGKVIDGELCSNENWNDNNTVQIENFTFGFSNEREFLLDDFPQPVVQLEFIALMPWNLGENKL